ncbi:MAG: DUF4252 domain-containing protein [Bacteroidales bacterium]|jgi:hypothetical protein|nr:DUF4252 domain-containing protein [Bacteroidales bacterium]
MKKIILTITAILIVAATLQAQNKKRSNKELNNIVQNIANSNNAEVDFKEYTSEAIKTMAKNTNNKKLKEVLKDLSYMSILSIKSNSTSTISEYYKQQLKQRNMEPIKSEIFSGFSERVYVNKKNNTLNEVIYIKEKKNNIFGCVNIIGTIDLDKIAELKMIMPEKVLAMINPKLENEFNLNLNISSKDYNYKGKAKINGSINIKGFGNNKDVVFVVDGKVLKDNSTLNPENIDSISVIKTAEMCKKYNSKGGVIFITTKKDYINRNNRKESSSLNIDGVNINTEDVVFIVDGEENKDINKLDQKSISSISVIKTAEMCKKYNTKNGVIIITTKKK